MPPSASPWLDKRDLEAILVSQTVLITALFKMPRYETVVMPRYLLEKYSTIFYANFAENDDDDPSGIERVIEISMNVWYNDRFPHVEDREEVLQAEWNMLKIFFKWMLCGRVVDRPDPDPKNILWSVGSNPLFIADVEEWVPDDGMATQAPAA